MDAEEFKIGKISSSRIEDGKPFMCYAVRRHGEVIVCMTFFDLVIELYRFYKQKLPRTLRDE